MNFAMAHSKLGRDRKPGRLSRRHIFWPAVVLIAGLPLMAACDNLLDAAGLERKADQNVASPPATAQNDPAPAPRSRKKNSRDLTGSTKIVGIQNMLNELGHDSGRADGILGPRTKTAIQNFQIAANMPVDGRVTTELSAALQREYNYNMETAEASEGKPGVRAIKFSLAESGSHDEQDEPYNSDGNVNETAANITASPAIPTIERIYGTAEEPYYEVGDNYIYSNGRVETATRINGNLTHWVANDGSRYTATNNFVMPPVKWENNSGSVQSSVVSSSNVKWPAAKAAELVFMAQPKDPNVAHHLYEAWSGEWTCGTEGESTIAVPAGKFDVVKIACEKTSGTSSQWRRHVWYYSPAIRHFVRKEETSAVGGQPTVVDLIAVRPGRGTWSRSARSGFNWAIQKLLERGAVGESIEWEVSDNGTEFDITLTGQIKTSENVTCRRYMLVRRKPGQPRTFPALACWDSVSGRWKIPGLEKGSVMPADVLASR
jgi:peptidoglycan hydrolase-like protein with peptidoglycan-binding domain